jgi:3-oxoacyl-[acyl-carrier-protein] synthase-3
MDTTVYLEDCGFALGGRRFTVEESARAGRLRSAPEDLRDAGFAHHHVCEPDESPLDLARRAAAAVGSAAARVDALLYVTTIPECGNVGDRSRFDRERDVKALMDFPASHLQAELGLDGALVVGVNQQACTGLLGSIRIARALLGAERDLRAALCLTADRFPEGALYEQAYNLVSDGAAACVLRREPGRFRLLACHGITNGALVRASDDETVGSFFALAARVVAEALARAATKPAEVAWVVPQNTHARAWTVLARMLGLARAQIYCPTRAEVGHVISGDNVVNLAALAREGLCRAGERLVLFMAGYGLTAQAVVLEAV